MIKTTHRRGNAAVGLALAVVVAGLLQVGASARADSTHPFAGRAEYASSRQAAQPYPNPDYPNHKPLRGNYPGSYASTTAAPAQRAGSNLDWRAAAVGAAGMLGLILVLAAARAAARMSRERKRRIPFVVDVRDKTPTTGLRDQRRTKLTAVAALVAVAVLITTLVLVIQDDDSPAAATQQPAAQAEQQDPGSARRITEMYAEPSGRPARGPGVAVRPQTGTPDQDGIE